ncbi:MAG: metallophosphatase [Bacteroidales bacterium]|nr:metallophosphatase [Bacteroidales bacterium]
MRYITYSLLLLFCGVFFTLNAQNRELVILHTNDTHSQIEPFTYKADTNVGGILRREAYVNEVRQHHPQVLLLDAGDFSQGTPYFNFFKGYMEVTLMNQLGYDAATLGNHEFDNGSAELAKRIRKAKFPVLCCNYQFHNKALKRAMKEYTIIQKDGLKIGIFGLGVNLNSLVAPEIAQEVTYIDPIPEAKRVVTKLQSKDCDMIICLSHLGLNDGQVTDKDLAKAVPEIDIIIGGHSHTELETPVIIGKTRICQMANRGKCIGEITIHY